jgi:hypothetical protein
MLVLRFRRPTPSGFRDLCTNVLLASHHIAEVQVRVTSIAWLFDIARTTLTSPAPAFQIHHEQIIKYEKDPVAHGVYEYFRAYFAGSIEALSARIKVGPYLISSHLLRLASAHIRCTEGRRAVTG